MYIFFFTILYKKQNKRYDYIVVYSEQYTTHSIKKHTLYIYIYIHRKIDSYICTLT